MLALEARELCNLGYTAGGLQLLNGSSPDGEDGPDNVCSYGAAEAIRHRRASPMIFGRLLDR